MKKFLAIVLAVSMLIACAACGGSASQPAASSTPAATTPATTATTQTASAPAGPVYDEVTLKLSHINAVDNVAHLAYTQMAEEVAEKSGGKINIDIYPAASLYGQDDGYDACSLGKVDICHFDYSTMTSKAPLAGVLSMGMFVTSYEDAEKIFYGSVGEKVNAQIEEAYNYHILGSIWNGFRVMVTNDPIDELADCKGYKLRVPATDLYLNIFVPMGFTPITTTWGEAYNAMQSGLCDGAETTVQSVYLQGFGALGGNVTKTNHILSVIGLAMNADKWNSLTPDSQALINEAWNNCKEWANESTIANEQEYYTAMEQEGINIMEWKDPQELVDFFTPSWAENAKAGGFEDLLAEATAAIR